MKRNGTTFDQFTVLWLRMLFICLVSKPKCGNCDARRRRVATIPALSGIIKIAAASSEASIQIFIGTDRSMQDHVRMSNANNLERHVLRRQTFLSYSRCFEISKCFMRLPRASRYLISGQCVVDRTYNQLCLVVSFV